MKELLRDSDSSRRRCIWASLAGEREGPPASWAEKQRTRRGGLHEEEVAAGAQEEDTAGKARRRKLAIAIANVLFVVAPQAS